MDNLIDLYNENQDIVLNFLDSLNMQVTLKLSGLSLQVYYNESTDSYEYRTHSDSLRIGPKISKLTRYFSQEISDSIDFIEKQKEKLINYRFLNILIYNKELVLLSAMRMEDTEIISLPDELAPISQEFGFNLIDTLFVGRLSKEQQTHIINLMTNHTSISSEEFKNYIMEIFKESTTCTNNFIDKLDVIEGIVLTAKISDKIAEYKIIDPNYIQLKKDEEAKLQVLRDKYKYDKERVVRMMADWLEVKAQKLDQIHMINMEKNFINMLKSPKVLMKMINVCAKIPSNLSTRFSIQTNKIDNDIQTLIRKHGNTLKTLYEIYLLTFYRKNENEEYDKELNKKINNIIEKL